MKKQIDILFELTKIRITSFVAFTTVFGYIAFAKDFNWGFLKPTIGILLLACGSAVINHYQERKTDLLMTRTKNRPIPSGKISANSALAIAIYFYFIRIYNSSIECRMGCFGFGIIKYCLV